MGICEKGLIRGRKNPAGYRPENINIDQNTIQLWEAYDDIDILAIFEDIQ